MSETGLADFILTFFSIVFGLVVAELVMGWVVLLRRQRMKPRPPVSVSVIVASLLGFLFVVQNWWALWSYRSFLGDHLWITILLVANPVLLQLGVGFVFPDPMERSQTDYTEDFSKRLRWVFGLFAVLLFKLHLDPTVINSSRYPLFRTEGWYRLGGIILLACGAIVSDKHKKIQLGLLIVMFALLVTFLAVSGGG